MTEIWNSPVCWTSTCGGELVREKDSDQWKCKLCSDAYLSCHQCEAAGEWQFEWAENTKGWDCAECNRWFCCSCFQGHGGILDDDDVENRWFCDACSKLPKVAAKLK